jgi:hypothetical protein
MSTRRSTWKRRERDAARLSGAERQVLSGSGGRGDRTRSDTTQGRHFIESKVRASSAVRSRVEGKTPVLALYAKGKPGALVVVHENDLAAVAAELAVRAQPPSEGCRTRR